MKQILISLSVVLSASTFAETLGQGSVYPKDQVPAQAVHTNCNEKTFETQFIGEVSSVEKAKKKDKAKGHFCRFKIAFNKKSWKPAEQLGSACPTIKRVDAQKHLFDNFENGRKCPKVGTAVSGVLIQKGKDLELDGSWE